MPDWIDQLTQMASGVTDSILGPVQKPPIEELGGRRRESLFPPQSEENPQDTLTRIAQPKSIAYSHSMEDLIANKYIADKQAPDPVPFYPSDSYLQKKLAPEKTIGRNEMERLAQARFKAIDMGVLDKNLADYMLPIAMVEGRPDSYGITHDNEFYASPHARRVFSQMGLAVEDVTNTPARNREEAKSQSRGADDAPPLVMFKNKRGEKMITLNESARDFKPELMAAILAIKAKGAQSPEDAVERWNGGGAQARHYRGKVQQARKMLDHPSNEELRSNWAEVTGED